MKLRGWGLALLLFSTPVFAALDTTRIYQEPYVKDLLPNTGVSGYVKLGNGDQLYVHVYNPESNLEPIVFFNGLSQDLSDWKQLFPIIESSPRPLIFIDNIYQGRSLKKYISERKVSVPLTSPLGFEKQIYGENAQPLFKAAPIVEQSHDILNLLEFLGVNGKFDLVGLSYGGGSSLEIASSFNYRARKVIMLAPYVGPLETQDQMIRAKVATTQKMFPASPYSKPEYEDELYDYFLRDLVYTTYAFSEPSILRWGALQLSGAYELIRGIRHINSVKMVKTVPDHSIHLVIAGQDQYIPEKMLMDFWESVPAEKRGSLLKVQGVEHKLNESVGPLIANYILAVTEGKWKEDGTTLSVTPEVGDVTTADGEYVGHLGESKPCEWLMLRPSNPFHPNLPINRILPSFSWMPRLTLSPNK